jgi:anthranilate phosphoribosyltransferase
MAAVQQPSASTSSSAKTSTLTPDTFKPLLKQLIQSPDTFDGPAATAAFEHVVRFPLACTAAQVGSFLTALSLTGKELDSAVVAASARVLRKSAVQVELGGRLPAGRDGREGSRIVDIVGTGGDGHDTFNVSTSAGIVAAGAGAVVCKVRRRLGLEGEAALPDSPMLPSALLLPTRRHHADFSILLAQHGNRASTSASGSADLLLSLACPLTFPPSSLGAILTPSSPFAFLFASLYHPAFAALGPLRKELPTRTLFNVLGPLVNPAKPGGIVLGVFKPALGPVFAEALRELGTERALVVCGREGLDEISPAGETDVSPIPPLLAASEAF